MDFKDQTGRIITLNTYPGRIVSLVPSQTELLFDLGLKDRIVGRTAYCIHPESVKNVQSVGGTKKQILHKVRSLRPDLIIGNKEENTHEMIDQLAADYPVWLSDVRSIPQALDMISSIGDITGTSDKAQELAAGIKSGFDGIESSFGGRAAYLIWEKPTMAVGRDTFIHEVMEHLGFTNVIGSERYPEINLQKLKAAAPDFLWLSSEPFPYTLEHVREYQAALPLTKVQIVDGEMFSWYGSRLLKSIQYFKHFNPH